MQAVYNRGRARASRSPIRRRRRGIVHEASELCNESLRIIKGNDSLGQVNVFGRLAGEFMGHSYTNFLAPIWHTFPDLEPPEMRTAYVKSDHVLSPESQEALRAFIAKARAAVRLAQECLPPDERAKLFAFDGLPEVERAVAAIEEFLALPRHRDEVSQE